MEWSIERPAVETLLVYLDDVIVVGKTFEDHLQYLNKRCTPKVATGWAKAAAPKCAFCKEHVEFLGHIVIASGVAVDPAIRQQDLGTVVRAHQ